MSPATDPLRAKLSALRTTTSLAEVRAAMTAMNGIVVAAAAKRIAADGPFAALAEELPAAFERLLDKPVKRDPTCAGKIAIARTLYDLERWDPLFAVGARYVQLEPAYGKPVDTAGELRAICGFAHAHFARPNALDVLAELLADSELQTRTAAARALGDTGRDGAAALLRFKLLTGDLDPEVLAACCESVLSIQQADAIELVARMLERADQRAEVCAVALGASRLAAAVAPLVAYCDSVLPETRRRVAYLALALTRAEPATARLCDVIATGADADALAAAGALSTFRDIPAVCEQVRTAARKQPAKLRAKLDALMAGG